MTEVRTSKGKKIKEHKKYFETLNEEVVLEDFLADWFANFCESLFFFNQK